MSGSVWGKNSSQLSPDLLGSVKPQYSQFLFMASPVFVLANYIIGKLLGITIIFDYKN
jgi:hypothetical protein